MASGFEGLIKAANKQFLDVKSGFGEEVFFHTSTSKKELVPAIVELSSERAAINGGGFIRDNQAFITLSKSDAAKLKRRDKVTVRGCLYQVVSIPPESHDLIRVTLSVEDDKPATKPFIRY